MSFFIIAPHGIYYQSFMPEIEKIENLFYIHFFLLLMILAKLKWKPLSRVQLFVNPWTIESKEFFRPEYWSG